MRSNAVRLMLLTLPVVLLFALGILHGSLIGNYDFWTTFRLPWSIAFGVLLVLASYGVGLPDGVTTRSSAALAGLVAGIVAALGISVAQLALGSPLLPRFVVFGTLLLNVPLAVVISSASGAVSKRASTQTKAVIVATESEAQQLQRDLDHLGVAPISVTDALSTDEAKVRLADTVRERNARFIVLSRDAQSNDAVVAQAAELHAEGVRVRTLSLFYEEMFGKLPLGELERVSLMFDIGEVHRLGYARSKRLFDVLAGLALCIAFAGMAVVLSLVNPIANRGPLLFRQTRVGRNGEEFSMLKFRTMREGGDSTWTQHGDVRITTVGRLLRRSHLDELPQAWNLVRGHLSLVGPRPEQTPYVELLRAEIPFYDIRHMVRPGLTGWAQVNFPYGASVQDAREKLQYDFYYLRRQGAALDARIILKTVRAIVLQHGR